MSRSIRDCVEHFPLSTFGVVMGMGLALLLFVAVLVLVFLFMTVRAGILGDFCRAEDP